MPRRCGATAKPFAKGHKPLTGRLGQILRGSSGEGKGERGEGGACRAVNAVCLLIFVPPLRRTGRLEHVRAALRQGGGVATRGFGFLELSLPSHAGAKGKQEA